MAYDIHLEIFEGPLDLLLYLIKKNDMEIADIPIAQITHEYIEYLEIMKELNLDIAGEFLVMAATLMQVKAKMLLPSQEVQEDEGPNPLAELKSKLLEYQKYKEVAKQLSKREEFFSDLFYRPAPVFDKNDYVLDVSLFDLLNSFRSVLQELPKNVKDIVYEEIPIEQRIREILDMFEGKEYLSFEEILKKENTKIGLILSFLAILELIRLRQLIAKQTDVFGAIRVYKVTEEMEMIRENTQTQPEVAGPQQELDLKEQEIKEENIQPNTETQVPQQDINSQGPEIKEESLQSNTEIQELQQDLNPAETGKKE